RASATSPEQWAPTQDANLRWDARAQARIGGPCYVRRGQSMAPPRWRHPGPPFDPVRHFLGRGLAWLPPLDASEMHRRSIRENNDDSSELPGHLEDGSPPAVCGRRLIGTV